MIHPNATILFCTARGLPPLSDAGEVPAQPAEGHDKEPTAKVTNNSKANTQALSFSSSSSGTKPTKKKRKAIGSIEDDGPPGKSPSSKKPKKAQKKLLSFGDDA
jgi:hypothetical protein